MRAKEKLCRSILFASCALAVTAATIVTVAAAVTPQTTARHAPGTGKSKTGSPKNLNATTQWACALTELL